MLGPRADGTSSETGLLSAWPSGGPKVIWKKQIGTGYSAPSVRDGRLVLFHRIGNEQIVEALDAKTAKPVWRHASPTRYRDPFGYNNGPRCTPLLTEKYCFTFGAEGVLLCLDIKTGKPVWQRKTAEDFQSVGSFFRRRRIAGGRGRSAHRDGRRAAELDDGGVRQGYRRSRLAERRSRHVAGQKPALGWPGEPLVRWRGTEKLASYATPTLATIHGKRTLLSLTRQGLVSMDPKTGNVNFSRWFRARVNESVNAANPIVSGNQVFCSAAYYSVGSFLIDIAEDGKSFNEVWSTNKRRKDNRRLEPVLGIHWTTPILHEGHLYAFSGRDEPDAHFRCVELESGRIKWSRDERWQKRGSKQPNVYGRGSAVMADGRLFVLGEGGLLGLFEVNAEKPVELGRHQVPELHYPCWAAPILSDMRMVIRSEDYLICFDVAK